MPIGDDNVKPSTHLLLDGYAHVVSVCCQKRVHVISFQENNAASKRILTSKESKSANTCNDPIKVKLMLINTVQIRLVNIFQWL